MICVGSGGVSQSLPSKAALRRLQASPQQRVPKRKAVTSHQTFRTIGFPQDGLLIKPEVSQRLILLHASVAA